MTDQNAPEGPQERSGGGSAGLGPSGPLTGAHSLDPHNAGPTVTECAEADRRWPLQKHGE
ncbi:hypothetical protein [Streptomyces albogriseolus]|uniref:hypothetical protein n=1 Tax=Streptomyces albogriseolus TaxID=1887 RepID=UPI003697E572